MISIALDIETTGVDPETSQILEIGFVVFDTCNSLTPFDELPKGKVRIQHQTIHGNIFAINMNKEIIADINRSLRDKDFVEQQKEVGVIYNDPTFNVSNTLASLIIEKAKLAGYEIPNNQSQIIFTAAGKNFSSFDLEFLKRLPYWDSYFKINRRSLDPTLEYFNPITDEVPPDLNTCVERMKDSIRSLIIKAAYDGDPEVCKDLEELEKVILHEHSERHDSLCDCWDVIRTLRFKWEKDKLV